ncbi:MAG: Crp/Fnr family transcriptional regulator [Pseudomonadota bacterium]|nr:Crp/Fnr family transcriptional regulator [Patescibacteria group bacterium]
MLNEFKIFKDLSAEDKQRLIPCFKRRHFAKKQNIIFPGSSHDYIYMVRSGRAKVSYLSPEGKEITVTILHPGDIYSMHSEATATMLEPAEIWYIKTDDFKKVVLQSPGLMANLIKILGAILKNTNDALLNLAFKEVNSRLATLLLKIAREKGVETDAGVVFEFGLTHEEIANLICSTRQTVTTILNRFEKSGLIEIRKKRVIVKDIEELVELS